MTPWRDNPRLKGKFHPDFPDDIEVIVHDGGPHMTNHRPENIWVRVTGCQEQVYTGTVLNQPYQLDRVRLGSTIKFLAPEGGEHPVMVTDKYLSERDDWTIYPCTSCGLTELFDAPSDLIRVLFPPKPENRVLVSFTSKCGACADGVQVVETKNFPDEEESSLPDRPAKKWWQFWK